MAMHPTCSSLADLRAWLDGIPDQGLGDPCSVCQTGEPYVVFSQYAFARPDDVAAIETHVASLMMQQLQSYFEGRFGRIYWRVPIETEVNDAEVIIRVADDGPDIDFVTNQRCVKDKNWKRVTAYCRLYRATRETMRRSEQRQAA